MAIQIQNIKRLLQNKTEINKPKQKADIDILKEFEESNWTLLSDNKREQVVKELTEAVKNRLKLKLNVNVIFTSEIGNNTIGQYVTAKSKPKSHILLLNKRRIIEGKIYSPDNKIRINEPNSNINALETVIHELYHAKQNEEYLQLKKGEIFEDDEQLRIKTIRWNLKPEVTYNDGSKGRAYVSLDQNDPEYVNMYILQPAEIDAERKTLELLKIFKGMVSDDIVFSSQIESVIRKENIMILNAEQYFMNKYNIRNPQEEISKCIQKYAGKQQVIIDKNIESSFIKISRDQYCANKPETKTKKSETSHLENINKSQKTGGLEI